MSQIWTTIALVLPWILKLFGFIEKANEIETAIKQKAKDSAQSASPSIDAKNKLNQHHQDLLNEQAEAAKPKPKTGE